MDSKAYGYVRVSTDKQENSVEVQTNQIIKCWEARRAELELVDLHMPLIVDQDVSGVSPLFQRPGGRQLAGLSRGDHVIITKIDRGFRNTRDALLCLDAWRDGGINIHLIEFQMDTSTSIGRMIFTIICSVAEFEVNRKSERIREVNMLRNSQGRPNATGGQYAVGWKKAPGMKFSDPWVPDDDIRDIAEEAHELYVAGMTYEEIYIAWRNAGRRRKNKKEWHPQAVQRLIKSYKEGFPILNARKRKLYQATKNGRSTSTPGQEPTKDSTS